MLLLQVQQAALSSVLGLRKSLKCQAGASDELSLMPFKLFTQVFTSLDLLLSSDQTATEPPSWLPRPCQRGRCWCLTLKLAALADNMFLNLQSDLDGS